MKEVLEALEADEEKENTQRNEAEGDYDLQY